MALIALYPLTLFLFVALTAYEGVFLIPFFSFIGIPLVLLQEPVPIGSKIFLALGGLVCIAMFVAGLIRRATWRGKALNLFGFYAWCALGYAGLTFMM